MELYEVKAPEFYINKRFIPLTPFLISLSIFLQLSLYSQIKPNQKRELMAKNFINYYNKEDYKAIRTNLFFLAKIIVNEKKLKESFEQIRDVWGTFIIADIIHLSGRKVEVKVSSERDITESETFSFTFTKKNKIKGFFLRGTEFIYPKKKDSANVKAINEREKVTLIDSVIQAKYKYGNFNGCVLVMENGRAIYKNCYGYSSFEDKKPLTNKSVFYLASCSKQFVATAILQLMEKRKLKLSDTLQKFIPELPYKNITIENLLTHTSGLPDYFGLMVNKWDKTKQATNYDVLNALVNYKPRIYFKPNEMFDYCNTGYALLAIIIEKASSETFSDYMNKNIFQPLEMKQTIVGGSSKEQGDKVDGWAYGHVYSDSLKKYVIPQALPKYNYVYYLDPIYGDGNINSSVTDLAKWENALAENKLVNKQTLEKAYSKFKLKNGELSKYGYGECIEGGNENEQVIYHSGGWPGFHSFIIRLPEQNKSVVILTNNEYVSFNQLADRIVKILLK